MIAVRDSIIASYRDVWNTWREIPYIVRDQMWNCFRCRCAWHTQHDHQISSNFKKKAADLLKDTLWTAQRKVQKPSWMFEDVCARLNEKWDSAKFQKKSTQAKAVRASDKGGSVGIGTNRRRLEKLKGRTITYGEVFEEPPAKKKKDGTRIRGKPHAEGTYAWLNGVKVNRLPRMVAQSNRHRMM
ncbi:uncharacterized protein LOC107787456 [Nicotiana tabacum]|uniref:Uncharacterized protein n=3 Tax=Nicotiana tabacum TaxID=4097 RepID=A0A1S3ZJL4_TOBAC|nr:uncharacterized protein LOC104086029 [Nicotiana tomentosiformis]XP_009588461.1 uncharacterized protein LOC104086029 [Nicotiana tomentosiformis]XP_009588462.1 uncharacterized protein LOC104086029 [Nicotiana tomentosiformis]XP_016464520.1 PREDICTED: uncharacterized protein LOC107787456 [Nicotiana tabacum]XP_016464521.1 PREDICTED: uncharacterized protein LOC107787456 [Nicotiana tabacum]XP_016464522.1 PREDICTED: uncharacterized protein LOC107787456 [Nicotiana tabacum]XP_016464523.1 PREDICTED: 